MTPPQIDLDDLVMRLSGEVEASPTGSALVVWHAKLVSIDDDEEHVVATSHLYVVDPDAIVASGRDITDVLDEHSGDALSYQVLFSQGGVAQEVFDRVEGAFSSSCVLIWDKLTVKPEFRGRRLGPLLGAMAIQELGRGCCVAACYPSPFEIDPDVDPAGHAAAKQRLERMWAEFGFDPFAEGVWVMDLSTESPIDKTLARLKEHF